MRRGEDDLAGREKLSARQEGLTCRDPLGEDAVIPAPCDVDAVDASGGLEPEAGSSGGEEQRRIRARPASPALAQVSART